MRLALIGVVLVLAGCATQEQEIAKLPPTSVENVVYYPSLVKGYENTYPQRRLSVIPVVDARDAQAVEGGIAPLDGRSLIGLVLNSEGKIAQRLYGPPLDSLTQDGIVKCANETGISASTSPLPLKEALEVRKSDYVVAAKILHLWVTRDRVANAGGGGGMWRTVADVQLEVAIYKPPFNVAFWQGQSSGSFIDPPPMIGVGSIDDSLALYDHPGEDLSVAFTRAVAGIFKRDDLHTLISEDTVHPN